MRQHFEEFVVGVVESAVAVDAAVAASDGDKKHVQMILKELVHWIPLLSQVGWLQ
jgi:hypothetical protein